MKNFDWRYVSCLSVLVLGCTVEEDKPETEMNDESGAFVLVAKQDTAVTRGGKALSALPIEGDADGTQELAFGGTTVELPTADGVVTYARSANDFDTLVLDSDVRADQLKLAASSEAAHALADAIGVDLQQDADGRWLLDGSDLWIRLASIGTMPGVTEVFPVYIGGEPGQPAAASASIGHASSTASASASALRELAAEDDPTRSLRCEDPVAGVWVGRNEDSRHTFTLSINTGAKGALRGTIDVRVDDGIKGQEPETTATMAASGSWKSGKIQFKATKLSRFESMYDSNYSLDHFTGSIDSTGVLAAVNNDGANAFDRPYEFRRVRCGL